MVNLTIGVIGLGHFGQALIKGIMHHTTNIEIKTTVRSKKDINTESNRVQVVKDIENLKNQCEAIIICVRPQNMDEVLNEIKGYEGLVISFAAGLPINYYESQNASLKVIRAMSNIAIEYGDGIIGWVQNKNCERGDEILFYRIFISLATLIDYEREDESHLDTLTAISGSGIAYLAQIFDTIKGVGIENGLSAGGSEFIVQKTVKGVLSIMVNSNLNLNEIVKKVASKGGTTEVGITTMEKMGMNKSLERGLQDTIEKCKNIQSKR